MTLLSDIPEQNPDDPTYDINIVIIDSKSNEIIAHFYEKKAFYDDAVFTDNITIDTARYQLSPTTRAFGIRFHKRNMARYNNYSVEILNLYYIQGKTLKLAARGLTMEESVSEWNDTCKGQIKIISRTLAIEKNNRMISTICESIAL